MFLARSAGGDSETSSALNRVLWWGAGAYLLAVGIIEVVFVS